MATNASQVQYTGLNLTYIGVTKNQTLDVILGEINTAVNSISPAPDYSGYSLGCMRDDYTIDTTQQFAEATAAILCGEITTTTTFIGTTYVNDQNVQNVAISALQVPALTYSYTGGGGSIAITNDMTINQVLTATYTGVGNILALLNAPGNTWSSLSISTPTNILTAFNDLISYLASLTTTVSGKQDQISTFDNSANCLAGGATDSIFTTVGELITYVCAVPTYTSGDLTWGCVTPVGNLEDDIQAIVTSLNAVTNNYVTAAGTGLTYNLIGSCAGYNLALDTTYTGLYKVMLSTGDTYSNAAFLDQKLGSSDSSITMEIANNKLNLTVAQPANGKVLVNSSDSTARYLQEKIPSNAGDWGLAISSVPSVDNSQLLLTPVINDPNTLISNIITYISNDPDLLAAFCALQQQCQGCTCAAPTTLAVALADGGYALTWVVGASSLSQTIQYRQRGSANWISNVNITAPNPQANTATSATVTIANTNIVYQFQVLNNCSGASNGSNIYESITFACQTPTITVTGGIISVNQTPMLTVDTITYQLINSDDVVVDTQIGTGLNPNINFATQAAGTYHMTWFMSATINGVTLNSNDSSQLDALCTASGIVIS